MLEIVTTRIGVAVPDKDRPPGFNKTIDGALVTIEHDGDVGNVYIAVNDAEYRGMIVELEIPYQWFVWSSGMIQMPEMPKKEGDDVDTD